MRRLALASFIASIGLTMPALGQPTWFAGSGVAGTASAGPQRDLRTVRVERERAEAEIGALDRQYEVSRERLRRRVRTLHRLRRAGALPLSEGFDGMLRHQARLHRLERLVQRDARAFQALGRRVSTLREQHERLQDEEVAAERVDAQQRALAQERNAQLAMLSEMIDDPVGFSGPSMGSGFGVRLTEPPPGGFQLAADRGRLPLPVAGSAEVRDAAREGGAGLELVVASGVTVRAVAPGRVSFAAEHPAYGRLVIVDHTDGHYTVYGGLGVVAVQPGGQVQRGSVLGAVGPQPVFFQVRRGTRPLPAREWLGI